MKRMFFTLLFFNIIISCDHKLNSKVENVVNIIAKKTCINSDSFWIREDDNYKNFLKVSTIEDLVYLTDNENPYVKYYAYLGLVDKNYSKIKEIYFKHKNDIESVYTTNGACLKGYAHINTLMLWELNPKDTVLKYCFTKDEYNEEYDKITK
jgi:hypothetical protein